MARPMAMSRRARRRMLVRCFELTLATAAFLLSTVANASAFWTAFASLSTPVSMGSWANAYTVSATAGPNGTASPKTQTVKAGHDAIVTFTPRTGYRIHTITDNGIPVAASSPIVLTKVTASHTVSATFAATTQTVTFDSQGGSPVTTTAVAFGVVVATPMVPTKIGYTFVGWYTDRCLTARYDFAALVRGDMTLYAKWIETNRVSFAVGKSKSAGEHKSGHHTIASIDATTGEITLDFGKVSPKNRRNSPEVLLVTNTSGHSLTLHAELSENLRSLFSEVRLDPGTLRPGAVAALSMKLSGRASEGACYTGTLVISDESGPVSTIIVRLRVQGELRLDQQREDSEVPSRGDTSAPSGDRPTSEARDSEGPSTTLTMSPAPAPAPAPVPGGEASETAALSAAEPLTGTEGMRVSAEDSSSVEATRTASPCSDARHALDGARP